MLYGGKLTCFQMGEDLSTSHEASPLQVAQLQVAFHLQSMLASLDCLNFLFQLDYLDQTGSYFPQIEMLPIPEQ